MKLYLSPIECEVLYRKKIKLGMTPIEASKNIKELEDYLHNMVSRLRKKGKSDIEIEKKFKLEWEKICQKAEI